MISARPIHRESVCRCCGRRIPGITPVILINAVDNFRPMVFCRRCYRSTFWGDPGTQQFPMDFARVGRQEAVVCGQ